MGTDSALYHKKTGKKIYCDRLYNLDNEVLPDSTREQLLTEGLSKFKIRYFLEKILKTDPKTYSYCHYILKELESKEWTDSDLFILIDDNDERY